MPEAVLQQTQQPQAAPPAQPAAPAVAPAEGDETVVQNTGDQATPATSEGDKPKEVVTPEQAAKRDGRRFERKLDKAYRERAEARAEAEFLRKRLAEAEAKGTSPADPGEPKLEQFKDIEEFAEAKAKYREGKALEAHQAKQHSETQKQAQAKLSDAWEAQADRGVDKYEDFISVVGDLRPDSPWKMAIMQAENGDDIAYYLGTNMKEAARINALDPVAQIREIGRLETKLLLEPVKPKTPSRAPAPITPLSGAAAVSTDVPSENDEMGAWMKKRQKQVHGKR